MPFPRTGDDIKTGWHNLCDHIRTGCDHIDHIGTDWHNLGDDIKTGWHNLCAHIRTAQLVAKRTMSALFTVFRCASISCFQVESE